jgi:hypothetical protein
MDINLILKNKYMSYKKLLLAGVISLFSVSCFYSCTKGNVYKGVVTVFRTDSDSSVVKIPVPNCKLIFGKEEYAPEVKREVYTDETGKYEGEWNREVSLEIQASKEISDVMYVGKSIIRLSPSVISTQEILIKPAE